MKKQIPAWAFLCVIVVALIGAFWSVGKASQSQAFTPGTPREGAIPPVAAPPIEGVTTAGEKFRLSDYKGKVVLLNVWATWCGPCRMEIPDLVEVQKKYADRGFTIVGLSDDDDLAAPKAFAAQNGMTYPILLTPNIARKFFQIQAIPSTFLINKEGEVVWEAEGLITEDQVSSEIEKLL